MPEAVVGADSRDIVRQMRTKEGSLTVIHNSRDIIANTIGHVLAIPTYHTLFMTWGSAFRNPSRELAADLFDRYKDVPWKGDVLVRVGHVDLFGDLQRIFARNEDVRGRPWMLKDKFGRSLEFVGKLGAAILTTINAARSKFMRSDYYNPFANTAVVYHPKLAVGMHELGHAEFYNQIDRNRRALYTAALFTKALPFPVPFMRSFLEYKATANAMKHFKTDTERRQGLKILEAAWSTYLTTDTLVAMSAVAPALALPLLNAKWLIPFTVPLQDVTIRGLLVPIAPYGAAAAGHLMNRLYPKKDQRFGYVFGGKEPVRQETRPLEPHQVLVATAKPEAGNTETTNRQYISGGDRNGKRPLHSNTHRITF